MGQVSSIYCNAVMTVGADKTACNGCIQARAGGQKNNPRSGDAIGGCERGIVRMVAERQKTIAKKAKQR
jgi:hypothetical protein